MEINSTFVTTNYKLSMTLKGLHGTSVSRAEAIRLHGFMPAPGRAGVGAYFWAYEMDRVSAMELAKSWWAYIFRTGGYNGDQNSNCAVIDVTIDVASDEFLDCDQLNVKEYIGLLAKQRGLGEQDCNDLYDVFVAQLETKQNRRYTVLKMCLPQPKKSPYRVGLYVANPVCYIVRDTASITINNIENP